MSDETEAKRIWSPQVNEMNRLSERAAKLSERGAHYFVGWLIGAGMQKPEMAVEFEKILHRLETDPLLRYCWRDFELSTADATPSEQLPLSFSCESPAVTHVPPTTVAEAVLTPAVTDERAPEHTRSGVVQFEAEPAPEPSEPTGFFARLFRRPRAAA